MHFVYRWATNKVEILQQTRFNVEEQMQQKPHLYDVTALGETLVDFTPDNTGKLRPPVFQANPGGAPCNVLAMLAKLGHRVGFIGKVGDDMFGRFLRERICEAGVDDIGLVKGNEARTTLAFVQIDESGDRDFAFFRNPGADMMLKWHEVSQSLLRRTKIFHFGTISMTHPEIREVTKKAVTCARDAGAMISFDPNLRLPLWESRQLAREQMLYGCGQCDILKIEVDELAFMTGYGDLDQAIDALRQSFPQIRLVLITAGVKGSFACMGAMRTWQPTFLKVKTIDTTGAGDSFMGACLSFVLEHGIDRMGADDLDRMLLFANAAASVVTTRRGAIASMPSLREIEAMLAEGV